MTHRRAKHRWLAGPVTVLYAAAAAPFSASAQSAPTLSDLGMPGLLQTPNARMLPAGRVFVGASQAEPYAHAFIGAQPLSFLTMVVRQSVGPKSDTSFTRLHPGLDVKLRLAPETRWTPSLVIGAQGIAGSARLSSEYIAASKRYEDFDFTLGVGWGRLGRGLGERRIDAASGPDTWFTGKFNLFGGVEYTTPIAGLSVKVEYVADSFKAERRESSRVKQGVPLNAGLAYRPFSWLELGAGIERGKEIMFRAALAADLPRLALGEPPHGPRPSLRPRPISGAPERRIVDDVRSQGIQLERLDLEQDQATAFVAPRHREPFGQLVGRTARIMANRADPKVEKLTVVAGNRGLESLGVQIYRADLERAQAHRGSPEEVWANAQVGPPPADRGDSSEPFLPNVKVALRPRLEVSFYELELPVVQRSSLLLSFETESRSGIVGGTTLRANLSDNLPDFQLREFLQTGVPPLFPVRSDVQAFASQPFGLERAYTAMLWSPAANWHARVAAGHFEEMYAGLSGEVLYRPVGERWAAGFDVNQLFKRLPGTLTDLSGDHVLTGHINLFHEAEDYDLTTVARIGRYLGRDLGATLELDYRFENGVRLVAFATWTDGVKRLDGSRTGRFDQGLAITIPLDGLPLVPRSSEAEFIVRPFGRDEGQRADIPLRLYDVTDPVSYRELARTWPRLMD